MSFDSLAPFYRTLEKLVFGNALERARTAFVRELSGCGSALIAGEGDGRFVAELLAANPDIRVTCVEQSEKMIQQAHRRIPASDRVVFIHGEIEQAPIERAYDAIVTNFFLDCFDEQEVAAIVDLLARGAKPNAIWLVAEFTTKWRGKLLVTLMYLFFRLTTRIGASHLPDYVPLLERHGFRREKRRVFYGGIVCAELWKRGCV